MNELAISGVLLALISVGVLVAGIATGEMPIQFRLDTRRDTAPAAFWGLAIVWTVIAILGLAIALRRSR